MLSEEKAKDIGYMIMKELSRNSLVDLCEYWGVTVEDFDEFIQCAFKYIDLQK